LRRIFYIPISSSLNIKLNLVRLLKKMVFQNVLERANQPSTQNLNPIGEVFLSIEIYQISLTIDPQPILQLMVFGHTAIDCIKLISKL
jgi:hypothetical protein